MELNEYNAGQQVPSKRAGELLRWKTISNHWLCYRLPGIPPTGKRVEVPFTAVVNIRGDRLYHEHIAWDQGTALAQLGLLPEYLPFPYPVPGISSADGQRDEERKYEYRLPIAGIDTANKLREKSMVPSNEMLEFSIHEC